MEAETWMNAEEALSRGFVDSITDELQIAAKVKHVDRYKHAPKDVLDNRPVPEKVSARPVRISRRH